LLISREYKNIFYNNFWFRNKSYTSKNSHYNLKHYNMYFRKYFYTHEKLTIEHSYFIRQNTPEYFPLRIYILKYTNWLIISLQWFKPVKFNKTNYSSSVVNITKTQALFKKNSKSSLNKSFRYKILLKHLTYSFTKDYTYNF
jgi:hypothetical protein